MKKSIILLLIVISLFSVLSTQEIDYFYTKEDVVVNINGFESIKSATLKRYSDGRISVVSLVNTGRIPSGIELDVWADIFTMTGRKIEDNYTLSVIVVNNEVIYIED